MTDHAKRVRRLKRRLKKKEITFDQYFFGISMIIRKLPMRQVRKLGLVKGHGINPPPLRRGGVRVTNKYLFKDKEQSAQ